MPRTATVWLLASSLALSVAACTLAREGTRVGEGDAGGTTTSAGGTGGTGTGGSGASSTGGLGGEGGATTSSGAGGTGGTGGGGPVESDCLNGVDDDSDGAADCDDSDCATAGYSCLAPAAGSLAHLVIAPSCPAATQPKLLRSCDATSCACGGSDGVCSIAVSRWNGSDCNGPADSGQKTTPGCFVIGTTDSSFQGTLTPSGTSTCAALAADIAADDVDACEVVGGSCSGGGACVPPGFPTVQACVLLPGGSSCEAPFDGYREVIYDNPASTCACSCSKAGATCEGYVHTYLGAVCSGNPTATVPIDGQCQHAGDTEYYYISPALEHATCDASATMAAGATTLCCTQAP